jgi:hypothetical protein
MSAGDGQETAIALFSFKGDADDYELSFVEGEQLTLVESDGVPDG